MDPKIKISGVGPLRKLFEDSRRNAESVSVEVGYTAAYALPVHEMVGANFQRPGAEAKFLENPLREMSPTLKKDIADDIASGMTLQESLFKRGLLLQRASQDRAPVDTGNMRSTAFTRIEE